MASQWIRPITIRANEAVQSPVLTFSLTFNLPDLTDFYRSITFETEMGSTTVLERKS